MVRIHSSSAFAPNMSKVPFKFTVCARAPGSRGPVPNRACSVCWSLLLEHPGPPETLGRLTPDLPNAEMKASLSSSPLRVWNIRASPGEHESRSGLSAGRICLAFPRPVPSLHSWSWRGGLKNFLDPASARPLAFHFLYVRLTCYLHVSCAMGL